MNGPMAEAIARREVADQGGRTDVVEALLYLRGLVGVARPLIVGYSDTEAALLNGHEAAINDWLEATRGIE